MPSYQSHTRDGNPMPRKTVQIPKDLVEFIESRRELDERGRRESFSSALVRYLRRAIEVEKLVAPK